MDGPPCRHDLEIRYKPGKENVVADALSRRPDHMAAGAISFTEVDPRIKRDILQGYELDSLVNNMAGQPNQDGKFKQRDGLWFYEDRLYIPNVAVVRQTLLSEYHDTPLHGHLGIDKTLAALQRIFYWPNMVDAVKLYIKTCSFCQRNKPSNMRKAGLLQSLDIPEFYWQSVSTDFITQLPETRRGNDALMVVVDRLSKMVILIPTQTTVTAAGAAKLFFENVFKDHGMPLSIVSDRDPRFTGNFWKALNASTGTNLRMSTAYHPQTDGLTERANRTVEQVLRNFVNDTVDDWDEHIAAVQFAMNNSQQASTKKTPFELVYGRHPLIPAALLGTTDTAVPAVNSFLNTRAADIKLAKKTHEGSTRTTGTVRQ